MKRWCTEVFNRRGYLCVSVSPQSSKSEPAHWTEDTIRFLVNTKHIYNSDVDNIFLYGYSGGGHTFLRYMVYTFDWFSRDRVRGMISDASSPGDSQFDWQRKVEGQYVYYPPYLMLHCTEDTTMKPQWSVEKSIKNINKANKKRSVQGQIAYKWSKYTKSSGCSHNAIALNYDSGKDSIDRFMSNVIDMNVNGHIFDVEAPFEGIPDKVDSWS